MSPIEKIRSLGLRSDLMIAAHKSVIEQKENYLVVLMKIVNGKKVIFLGFLQKMLQRQVMLKVNIDLHLVINMLNILRVNQQVV